MSAKRIRGMTGAAVCRMAALIAMATGRGQQSQSFKMEYVDLLR
jgi:hypothetical protein